jgi:uncharacterized protein involved in copper resistance
MKLALLAAIALLLGCGGGKTTASKSAAAFDEAQKTAVPVAAAQPHVEAHHEMPAMNHSTMDHSAMPAMDHSSTMDHASMPGMDHSKTDHSAMPGMDHSKTDHSAMPGMDHSTMPAMQHMQHGSSRPAPTPRPAIITPPSSATIPDPVMTLRPDEFDAPPPPAHDHGEGS